MFYIYNNVYLLGVVLPYGISLVQNYGKYPRLHHLSMTEIFFFCFQNKKNSQKHLEVSWKVCTFALAIKQMLQ